MKILITGATGLIGKELGKVLAEKGHQLLVVSRNEKAALEHLPFPCEVLEGDLTRGALTHPRLKDVDAVVNLMGEPVVGSRWNAETKKRIYDSRVLGTRHLIASLPANLKVFVGGSAIGFYGNCSDSICDEDRPAGKDFLAHVTVDWEKESMASPGRRVLIRTGVVLAQQGGALDKMLFPFKAGVGGMIGDGRQWMSWIHIKDIVGLFAFALENESVSGVLNGVAPSPVTNKYFSQCLASSLGKGLSFPVPTVALKALYGQAAETILASVRGSAVKVEKAGYHFQYRDLKEALADICASWKAGEEVFLAEQFVQLPPEGLFEFFKDPKNLEQITPPSLSFHIVGMSTSDIQQGTLIDYKLKIHSVPAKWKTEIDEWQPPRKFVDNQLSGPYSLWHHTHEFRSFCGGTLMVDRVRYRLPMGYLGWLFAAGFVRKDISSIFSFRRKFIAEKFYKKIN